MARSLHDLDAKYAPHSPAPQSASPAERAQTLIEEKEHIQSQLDAQYDVLTSNGTDLRAPLVDAEGFPRSDIADLASVRVARRRIHELRNDLRDCIEQLKLVMEQVFAKPSESTPSSDRDDGDVSRSGTMTAFARVNSVAPHSPSQTAGLCVGDAIIRFGTVDATNHDKLAAVGRLVQASQDQSLQIAVMRGPADRQTMLALHLTPTLGWGGTGLLGCHIVPI